MEESSMGARRPRFGRWATISCAVIASAITFGCASDEAHRQTSQTGMPAEPSVVPVGFQHSGRMTPTFDDSAAALGEPNTNAVGQSPESLSDLEGLIEASNPTLRRLADEVEAARAKAAHVDRLPDPAVGVNVFGHPIETAAGSQRANMTVMQMIPWLARLDAQSQQACFEALAAEQVHEAERLRLLAQVRANWHRLYVLGKQLETNRANQELLNSLIEVANSRVSTGAASQGDVLLGTLELSKLAEQQLVYERQIVATKAEINRLVGRSAEYPIAIPRELRASLPSWTHEMLRQIAWQRQPEIAAAELRTQATRWGVEVARLSRRPNFSVGAGWFAIDDNRPASSIVDVGHDAWSVGAQVSVPLWRDKYDALEQEAAWRHSASHASVEELMQRYDALLLDLWQRAKTADETAKLYQETLLPQARQTIAADRDSYANSAVEFDRVIRDFRSLLMLELGRHQALGELATELARIRQAIGTDLAE